MRLNSGEPNFDPAVSSSSYPPHLVHPKSPAKKGSMTTNWILKRGKSLAYFSPNPAKANCKAGAGVPIKVPVKPLKRQRGWAPQMVGGVLIVFGAPHLSTYQSLNRDDSEDIDGVTKQVWGCGLSVHHISVKEHYLPMTFMSIPYFIREWYQLVNNMHRLEV